MKKNLMFAALFAFLFIGANVFASPDTVAVKECKPIKDKCQQRSACKGEQIKENEKQYNDCYKKVKEREKAKKNK